MTSKNVTRINQTTFNIAIGLIAVCLVLFLGLLYQVFVAKQLGLDMQASQLFHGYTEHSLPVHLAKLISLIASEAGVAIICAASLILTKVLHKRFLPAISLCWVAFSIGAIEFALKYIFCRPRPLDSFQAISFLSKYSFPSAHSMLIIGFYGFLLYLLVRHHYVQHKALVTLGWLVLVLLTGVSRLMLHMHYLTDVLAAYLLGIPVLLVAILLYERAEYMSARKKMANLL